jgi:hypothetical protein
MKIKDDDLLGTGGNGHLRWHHERCDQMIEGQGAVAASGIIVAVIVASPGGMKIRLACPGSLARIAAYEPPAVPVARKWRTR